jgi:hypothetical protein
MPYHRTGFPTGLIWLPCFLRKKYTNNNNFKNTRKSAPSDFIFRNLFPTIHSREKICPRIDLIDNLCHRRSKCFFSSYCRPSDIILTSSMKQVYFDLDVLVIDIPLPMLQFQGPSDTLSGYSVRILCQDTLSGYSVRILCLDIRFDPIAAM